MPPKTWDDSSEEESSDDSGPANTSRPVPVAARKHFDDEEDSDDAPDNWDEEPDSDEEREKAKQAAEAKAKADALAAANKKSKAQRIEEHREANRRRRAAEDDEDDESSEDEAEKRARLKAQEKAADLSHAEALIGDVDARNNKKAPNKATVIADDSNPGAAIDLSKLTLFQPKTKTQFDALSETLTPLIRSSTTKAHFPLWMPQFAKGICQDMNSVDIKKVASALTALSNEKLKQEKMQDGSGKKSKAAKSKTTLVADRGLGQGRADTEAYDGDGLDDGDFM